MNFKFFGFDFSFFRSDKDAFSITDVELINKINVHSILSSPVDYYFEKLKDIEVKEKDLENGEAVSRIIKDGIFVIPNFIDSRDLDSFCSQVDSIVDVYKKKLLDDDVYEDCDALIQKNAKKLKGYKNLVSYPKSVFDIRSGSDKGMIDIFNINKVLNSTLGCDFISKILDNSSLKYFLSSMPDRLSMQNVNAYINSGITSTRGFHVDSYVGQVKIFIYLTDVLSFDHGPYTYVKGTHVNSSYRRMNKHLSQALRVKTEAPIVPRNDIYPILAPKGALVVSNQAGFHMGFPQLEGGFRRVLTINCK